jgi:hypothetical protein
VKNFLYAIDGHTYKLVIEYSGGGRRRCYVTGAEMYNLEGEYVGYWHRANIPVNLLKVMAQHVKNWELAQSLKVPNRRRGI